MIYIIIGVLLLLTIAVIVVGVLVSRRGDSATLERLDQFVGDTTTAVAED
jgi:regulator of protease activity HflC (stomatin/prohibitin superfamily)